MKSGRIGASIKYRNSLKKKIQKFFLRSVIKILDSVELNMNDKISIITTERTEIEYITFQLETRDNNKGGKNNQPRS